MDIPEGKERKKGSERIFKEIMVENSPNLMIRINLHVHKFQQTPSMKNSETHTPTPHNQTGHGKIKANLESSKGEETHQIKQTSV